MTLPWSNTDNEAPDCALNNSPFSPLWLLLLGSDKLYRTSHRNDLELWSSTRRPVHQQKQNQSPLVFLSTSFFHLTTTQTSNTTSGKASTEQIHLHKAQVNHFLDAAPEPHAERRGEDTTIYGVNKLSCWFHFGAWNWSIITKSIWWNDPGLSDSFLRGREVKGGGFKLISLSPSVAILSRTIQ